MPASPAGFRVPGGFLVTTAGYTGFVASHGLQRQILELARPDVVRGRASFERPSALIGQLFEGCAWACTDIAI